VARWLGIDPRKVRLINKYNGGSFGGVSFTRITGFAAHIAKLTGRPVKYSGSIEETIAEMNLKPFIISKFKVGANKDGRIMALRMETIQLAGDIDEVPNTGGPLNESARDQFLLYGPNIPNWEHVAYCYKSNTPQVGANRSNTQQEFKWGFENMMSEMAEALSIDPAKFRLMHVAKPGQKLDPAKDWGAEFANKPEAEKGTLTFDSYASREIIEEAATVFGWDKRNPKAGSVPGRFKKGMGMTVSDHHAGHLGWRDGEVGFARERETFGAEVELDAEGFVTLKNALPCSGTDHYSGMAMTVSEMLGFTNLE
jgi:CO/xanthine dehydrogenase Mo-binding subunit